MHNAPGAYSRYAQGVYFKCTMLREHVKYAPGAVYIQILLLEHIELRILPQIDYSCSGSILLEQLFLEHLLLEYNFGPKISQKITCVKK